MDEDTNQDNTQSESEDTTSPSQNDGDKFESYIDEIVGVGN